MISKRKAIIKQLFNIRFLSACFGIVQIRWTEMKHLKAYRFAADMISYLFAEKCVTAKR